ncbi:hypothetical protein F5888DRAFT_1597777, partial [Russula emetica]
AEGPEKDSDRMWLQCQWGIEQTVLLTGEQKKLGRVDLRLIDVVSSGGNWPAQNIPV